MTNSEIKKLRAVVAEYTQPSLKTALAIFSANVLVYATAMLAIIFLENLVLRLLCGIAAGFSIGTLFLIAHDAAHNSYTGSKLLNRVLGRICFLPSLHNYSLWLIAHNRLHHRLTNIRDRNSWSPVDPGEYGAMPGWRRLLERFYRHPSGIWLNYLIERWWKNKFFPYRRITGGGKIVYWTDFILVLVYLAAFLWLLAYAGASLPHTSVAGVQILGFVVPFLSANYVIGFTIYQHHTHESIPWFEMSDERRLGVGPGDIIMHVLYPRWYNVMTFNAMEHTAHHVDFRIPLYHLGRAQRALAGELGKKMHTTPFSLAGFLRTMRRCKLYDYQHHCWLDFEGRPTTGCLLADEGRNYAKAA